MTKARPSPAQDLIVAAPMEARSAQELPVEAGWWFEPKWDGFRCLAHRQGARVRLQSKAGKDLSRYFPDVVALFAGLSAEAFVLDGELLIAREGRFSFEALQDRLHPALSRINRLADEAPALYAAFDLLLAPWGEDLRRMAFQDRRVALQAFFDREQPPARLSLTSGTTDRQKAQAWLEDGDLEGVMAKRRTDPYLEGERAMIKVKRRRTADCVVGGFRFAQDRKVVGSLLLGLYDDQGLLNHVGFASGLSVVDKPALTRRLTSLISPPGFTGDAPGGPSRWANGRSSAWEPLRPELVVEVSYDHVSAGRFRHGTRLVRLRPDKAPSQCRFDQLG